MKTLTRQAEDKTTVNAQPHFATSFHETHRLGGVHPFLDALQNVVVSGLEPNHKIAGSSLLHAE